MSLVIKGHRNLIIINLFFMAAVFFWIISYAVPVSKDLPATTEVTRLRNALLADVGLPAEVNWNPGSPMKGFLEEVLEPPLEISKAYKLLNISGSNFEKSIGIAYHLRQGEKKGGPIMEDTVSAYRRIVQEGEGYCADYTQVFNALAHAANIPVREWGLSFDNFGGRGHAFNEIYDFTLNKWVFIDPFNSFYVRKMDSDIPLSVLEFREYLLNSETNKIDIIPIVVENFGFRSKGMINKQAALEYYSRGRNEFYLWEGNNVFSYDNNSIVKLLTPVSRALEQLAAIVLGVHPGILILKTEHNHGEIENLISLRHKIVFALITELFLFFWFIVILIQWRKRA